MIKNMIFKKFYNYRLNCGKGGLLVLILLCACTNDKEEIYQLSQFSVIYEEQNRKKEYYVIPSPPSDRQELVDYVIKFNRENIDSSDFIGYDIYRRIFFQETYRLNENYEEDTNGYFKSDHIDDNHEDILIVFDWKKVDSINYNVFYSLWKEGVPDHTKKIDFNF